MANRRYTAGRYAEWAVRDILRAADWLVMRSYASKGPYDLLAIARQRDPILVQVKTSRLRMPKLASVSPSERAALVETALWYDAEAIVAAYHQGEVRWWRLYGRGLEDNDPWNPNR